MSEKPYTPWQQRVIEEFDDLSNKIEKLWVFLNDADSPKVSIMESMRLVDQYNYMKCYAAILQQRIQEFTS